MKKHARPLIVLFAALGLAASITALFVHYQLLADPSYTSFCDVSETVSCEAVLTSAYGRFMGVPVAVGGALWAALVLILGLLGMQETPGPIGPGLRDAPKGPGLRDDFAAPRDARAGRVAGYVFVLSTLGLAGVLYLGYASFFVLKQACPLCLAMYVAVIGTFVVSGAAASDLSSLPGSVGRDLRAATSGAAALTMTILWVAAAVGLVALFPREEAVSASAASEPAVAPTETLGADEVAQFEAWLAAQPRVPLDLPATGARVTIVKFNDYQCPACRQAYLAYKSIQQKYTASHPGQVAFVNVDYPLEAECNTGGIHAAACEAAVAVRLARVRNRGAEMEAWLFDNQEGLTRDRVKEALVKVAQVTDFDAQYPTVLQSVRADAQLGQKVQITGTPTFFINGIRINSTLRPSYMDAAIAYELRRSAQ